MTDADVSAMAKESDNKEEENGCRDITVVRKIRTSSKKNQNNYQKKKTLCSA
jgi:hypothetical protein